MLSFGVLVEDLLVRFMYISQFRRYAQLSSGTRDIFVTSSRSHTSTSMRQRTSKILDTLLQGQEQSRSSSALSDVNPHLSSSPAKVSSYLTFDKDSES